MRKTWEEHGGLGAACFVLFGYLFWQVVEHTNDPSVTRDIVAMFLLPISAFCSVRTVVRLASQLAPSVGWWLHGTLCWASWWVLHAAIATMTVAFIASNIHDLSDMASEILLRSALGLATVLTLRQILRDYRAARRRFGSLAQAERALHWSSATRLQRGYRL